MQDLDEGKSQIAHGETVRETANMISFMADVIGIRDDMYIGKGNAYMHEVVDAVTEGHKDGILQQKPTLVNLQCDIDHPTQAMADMLHIIHEFGGVENLKGKKIGAQLGTTGYIYAGDVEDATVEPYNKGADAVQALKQGKLDAVIIDSEPAKAFVAKNDTLKILDDPFAEEEYAIAYKKGNDELGQKLDDALTKLKEDGTLDEIVSHWIGDNADQKSYTPDDSVERDGTLVMATNAEFPPYESVDGDTIVGVDVDMMQAVCDEIGMELKVENMEFDSIIAAVQSGKADVGVAGMTVTPDREENVSFTQGYATTTQVIIVRKD